MEQPNADLRLLLGLAETGTDQWRPLAETSTDRISKCSVLCSMITAYTK